MKLTIDNLDGLGASRLQRGAGSIVSADVGAYVECAESGQGQALSRRVGPWRSRAARAGCGEHGRRLLLFTGYLAYGAGGIYAGVASEGPVYRLAFSAVSDEWLLDKQAAGAQAGVALGGTGVRCYGRW